MKLYLIFLKHNHASSNSLQMTPCTLLLKIDCVVGFFILLHLQLFEDLLCDCVNIFSNVLDGNNLNGWLELQEVSN